MIYCNCTYETQEFNAVVTVKKINVKKDVVVFYHNSNELVGIYSAWVGAKGRLLKKGDRIRIHVCNWGHGEWNPAWSCEGESSVWRLVDKGKKMIKKGEKK